jgi:multidrug efflux pump subunit AcrA (membrane-fusion protein)
MSDTLKTNEDKSLANIPVNDFQPLFQDDDEELDAAPPKRRPRIWLIIVSLILIVALIAGILFYSRQRADAAKVQYTTAAVTVGNISRTVSASGPLQPKAEYDMNFGASGQVTEIDVHVGQQVTSGTVLGKVSSPALDIAVQQAQIAVNNAQETYNTAVTNGLAQTTIDADNNALQTAKLQLQNAQNNQSAETLKAPANATVASINAIVGQNAGGSSSSGGSSSGSGSSAGSSSGSSSTSSSNAAFVLVDSSGFTITAAVNEADIASVQVNQPVRFTLTSYPSQTFRATVTNVGIVGTTSSGVVTYPVVLTVDMSTVGSAHLYAGMTATANITTGQRIGVPLVNNSAFTFTTTALQAGVISRSSLTQAGGSARQGSSSSSQQNTSSRRVVLVMRNNKLVPVLVTVGLTNGTSSEVVSGLNEGDQVVVGATGGAFNTLSSSSSSTGGLFRGGAGGAGGFGGGTGGTRGGGTGGGGTGTGGTRSGSGG